MIESNFIYLDYQASAPPFESVINSMNTCIYTDFSNPHSVQHIAGIQSLKAIKEARRDIASLIKADDEEVIFTSGATESNNLAILGVAKKLTDRKRILVSSIEHKCVLAPAESLMNDGFVVEQIPVTKSGEVDMQAYNGMLHDDVALVSIMTVNNEIGTIQPIKKLAHLAHEYGALFHTDAAQAVMDGLVNVKESGVDLMSLSSHKMHGPKGIGILYISHDIQESVAPLIYGGGQQNGLRAGTLPTHLCVGMGAAARFIQENQQMIQEGILSMRKLFWNLLQKRVSGARIIGPNFDCRHSGNLNVCFKGVDAHILLGILQLDIGASSGSACTSGTVEPSHVLSAIGLPYNDAECCVRFSLGYGVQTEDVSRAADLIGKTVDLIRNEGY
jgi:cysteine desulfurase